MNEKPYESLSPHLILDAVEHAGFQCSGSLFALNSFENRVYQIGLDEGAPIIAKFYRPGRWSDAAILEEHKFSKELADLEIPVIAPIMDANHNTLHTYENFRFALFPRQSGRAFESDNVDNLERIGRLLGRMHAMGSAKPFTHRITLNVNTYGFDSFRFLSDNDFFPAALRQQFNDLIPQLLEKIITIMQAVGSIRMLRLHGDFHVGNILWNEDSPWIVDLDDCLMGPAIQDIWMLLTGDTPQEVNLQLSSILEGYEEFHMFNYREIHLIEVQRTLRMLQYCAWLAKRWNDPTFPIHFPWFNTFHYWEQYLADLGEQNMLLDGILSEI